MGVQKDFKQLSQEGTLSSDRHPHFRWSIPPGWLGIFLVTILILSIFFRFANLDRKIYWFDEVVNTLYTSGYTQEGFVKQVWVWNNRELKAEDLQQYQRIKPDSTPWDVVKALAFEEPQSSPIYYLLSRKWIQLFGNSVTVRRSLSALLSLLTFPFIYWLCLELSGSSLVGWVAIALVGISPFLIVFSQEVRMYSTWGAMVLLSSAIFLRAMRINKKSAWTLYSASVILSLYTFPLSGVIVAGHGLYVAILEKFRFTKTFISYLLASLIGALAFSPLIVCLILNSYKMGTWRRAPLGLLGLIKNWVTNLNRSFIYIPETHNLFMLLLIAAIAIIPVCLVAYSFYFVLRETPPKVGLFLFTFTVPLLAALALPDILFGGLRSTITRYLIPSYLGVQLTVAYLLATKMSHGKPSHQQRWKLATVTVITMGLISCIVALPAQCDFNKKFSCENLQIAQIINQAKHPLMITSPSHSNAVHTLSLTYLLNPQVTFQFVIPPKLPEIPDKFSDIFIYSYDRLVAESGQALDYQLDSKQRLEPIFIGEHLKLHKLTLVP